MNKRCITFLIVVFLLAQALPAFAWGWFGGSSSDVSRIDSYRSYQSTAPTAQQGWFSSVVSNVGNFISSVVSAVGNAVSNFSSAVVSGVKSAVSFVAHPIITIKDWLNSDSTPDLKSDLQDSVSTDIDEPKELDNKLETLVENRDEEYYESEEYAEIAAAKWAKSKGYDIPDSSEKLLVAEAEQEVTLIPDPSPRGRRELGTEQGKQVNPEPIKQQDANNIETITRQAQEQIKQSQNQTQLAQTTKTLQQEDMVKFDKFKIENPEAFNNKQIESNAELKPTNTNILTKEQKTYINSELKAANNLRNWNKNQQALNREMSLVKNFGMYNVVNAKEQQTITQEGKLVKNKPALWEVAEYSDAIGRSNTVRKVESPNDGLPNYKSGVFYVKGANFSMAAHPEYYDKKVVEVKTYYTNMPEGYTKVSETPASLVLNAFLTDRTKVRPVKAGVRIRYYNSKLEKNSE